MQETKPYAPAVGVGEATATAGCCGQSCPRPSAFCVRHDCPILPRHRSSSGSSRHERDAGLLSILVLCWPWPAIILRAILYALALSMSHRATFAILKNIRERLLAEASKAALWGPSWTPPAAR